MYSNNLKLLRNERDLTQEYIANFLNIKRGTYSTWENGFIMIPIEKADKLSTFYKVKLSYVIGVDKDYKIYSNIKEMNYEQLLTKLSNLKKKNNNTFEDIASYLNCNRSTCQRYFNNVIKFPIDRLVLLSKFYEFDIDDALGKI